LGPILGTVPDWNDYRKKLMNDFAIFESSFKQQTLLQKVIGIVN